MKKFAIAAAATVVLSFAGAANAATSLLTTDVGYTGPSLNLTGYDNGNYNFTFGPVALAGGMTLVAAPGGGGNSGLGSVVGQGNYGLASNGSFGGSAVYIGVDSNTGFDTVTLAGAVSQIGFYFNYAPDNGGNHATITALDNLSNVLGAYDLETLAPISTPGGFNQFQFRGISSTSANIAAFRFGGDYILASGSANGAVIAPGGVPETATWAMMMFGFAGLGLMLRTRRRTLAVTAA